MGRSADPVHRTGDIPVRRSPLTRLSGSMGLPETRPAGPSQRGTLRLRLMPVASPDCCGAASVGLRLLEVSDARHVEKLVVGEVGQLVEESVLEGGVLGGGRD